MQVLDSKPFVSLHEPSKLTLRLLVGFLLFFIQVDHSVFKVLLVDLVEFRVVISYQHVQSCLYLLQRRQNGKHVHIVLHPLQTFDHHLFFLGVLDSFPIAANGLFQINELVQESKRQVLERTVVERKVRIGKADLLVFGLRRVLLEVQKPHELGIDVVPVDVQNAHLEQSSHDVGQTSSIRQQLHDAVGNAVVLDLVRRHEEVSTEYNMLRSVLVFNSISRPVLFSDVWTIALPHRLLLQVQEVIDFGILEDIDSRVLRD